MDDLMEAMSSLVNFEKSISYNMFGEESPGPFSSVSCLISVFVVRPHSMDSQKQVPQCAGSTTTLTVLEDKAGLAALAAADSLIRPS